VGGWRAEATPEQAVRLAELCGAWLIENRYEADQGWVSRVTAPGLAKAGASTKLLRVDRGTRDRRAVRDSLAARLAGRRQPSPPTTQAP
jgi:hypothetical protein